VYDGDAKVYVGEAAEFDGVKSDNDPAASVIVPAAYVKDFPEAPIVYVPVFDPSDGTFR
jgi:hypothetical protein